MRKLVKKYEQLGVKLWVEKGNLKFRAPKGVLTLERKLELKENKEKIIKFLSSLETISHDEKNRYTAFPLTDIQSAYLIGSNQEYGSGGVDCKVYLEFVGQNIDAKRLNTAWKKVVLRHDMMRAIIHQDGTQQVLKTVMIPDIRIVQEKDNLHFLDIRKELVNKNYHAQEWPLYDLCLVHEKEKDILCFSMSMLVADFTSMTILFNELERIYQGEELGRLSEVTFRDIVIDKVSLPNEKIDQAKKYWLNRLESIPQAPNLPIANSHPSTTEFIQKKFILAYEDWQKIELYAKDNSVTATSLILNIYADILYKWSREHNFTINVTMADRKNFKTDVSGLIGDFTIVNLLEINYDYQLNFLERSKKIQKQLWQDLENTAFSGVSVIRELKRIRENTLFPFVFTSTLGFKAEMKETNNLLTLNYKISKTPQVWIDCQISEEKEGILVNWDVRDGVFPAGMIDEAFLDFEQELRLLAQKPKEIDTYQYQINPEVKKVRAEVNHTEGTIPSGFLYDEFLDNVKKYPDQIAVIDDGVSYTYKQLYVFAKQIADALSKKKISVGTVVAVDLAKSVWSIAAAIGIMMAQATYLPLDISQPLERKKEILKVANTDYGIYEGETKLFFKHGINIDLDLPKEELSFEDDLVIKQSPLDPAYIIFTSGSTGKPKGVIISHRSAKNTIIDTNERFSIHKDDKVLALADNAFDLSIYDLFGLLSAGGTLIIPTWYKRKDPQHWYDLINKHKITIWNSVPAQMQILTSYVASIKGKLSSLKKVMLSGDWIPTSLPKEIFQMSADVSVICMGGATEASIWSNYYIVDKNEEFDISVPYGKPLKNQHFYVLDENMLDCPNWVIGELYIGGIGLADGYKNNEKETKNHFVIHPLSGERLYKTGDLGRYWPDGNIEFLGRVDHQVKINGHRIEIQEIENKLKEIKDIRDAVISVRKKDSKATGLDAFVTLETSKENQHMLVDPKLLGVAVKKAGDEGTANINRKLFYNWTKTANMTALYDILAYLKEQGLFIDHAYYNLEDIYKKTKVKDDYQQLIRRWLKVLCKEKLIIYDHDKNAYQCLRQDINRQTSIDSWHKWWNIENELHYSQKLVAYFQDSSHHLPQLVTGKIDALDIFFPKGDFTIAKAAYHDNLLSKSLNKVIIGAIHNIHGQLNSNDVKRKINIIEIGAGIGGASLDVIPSLEGYNVSYYFTDVSQYFLNGAKKNFGQYNFVTYGLFDINKPYWEQGICASQFDLIICNNVLHNAKSLPDVLQSFREMLVPGGAFIIEDTTGENYSLLTSMEFHAGLSQFEDFRKYSNYVFVTREQWHKVFAQADANISFAYPTKEDDLSEAQQVVFVGQFVNRTKLISKDKILKEIQQKVPSYMVPTTMQILDQIPLNKNGKIDHKALDKMMMNDENQSLHVGHELQAGLESKIGAIWQKALNREKIYRDENFYKAGGDSLLLAQIVSQMKENISEFHDWEWNKIMTLIMQSPTIEGIVQKLNEHANIETPMVTTKVDTDIKVIKEVKDSKRVIVLFHDGTGTLSPYSSLISKLKERIKDSLIGIYVHDPKKYIKHKNESLLTELGIQYAQELLATRYKQFCLIGYCMGGLVAIETAKNLLAEKVTIEPVITIDTTPSDARICNDILMERTFGKLIDADLTECGYLNKPSLLKKALFKMLKEDEKAITVERMAALDGEFKEIGENTQALLKQTADERLRIICQHVKRLNQEISTYQYEQMKDLYAVIKKSFLGMSLYGNEFFMGDVIALNCKDKNSNFLPILDNQNQAFWEKITLGDLQRVMIDGDHLSCMQDPYVENIATFILQISGNK